MEAMCGQVAFQKYQAFQKEGILQRKPVVGGAWEKASVAVALGARGSI